MHRRNTHSHDTRRRDKHGPVDILIDLFDGARLSPPTNRVDDSASDLMITFAVEFKIKAVGGRGYFHERGTIQRSMNRSIRLSLR